MAEDDTTRVGTRQADAEALGAGDEFAGLRIDGIAGRGGSGIVYRAWDLELDQPRALKVLFPDLARGPRFRERFERESRLLASLEHPSVVRIYRAGEHAGQLFFSMQLIDGETLADLLERDGPLPRERTIAILRQVAAALDAARAQGLVHRDVKPANILIDSDRAYLTDFGIAKHTAAAEPLTEPGEMIGTANYVAPEQVTGGEVSPATDVYALACVAYECLNGSKPFERETKLATLVAHTTDPRPRGIGLDARTSAVLSRGMSLEPADRHESASELIDALGDPPATALFTPRRRLGLALAALVGLLAVGAVLLSGGGEDPDTGPAAGEPPREPTPAPRAGSVERRIELAHPAGGVTVGNIKVWTAGIGGLTGIDPATGVASPELSTDAELNGVAIGLGSVWATDRRGILFRFDPSASAQPVPIPLEGEPTDVVTTPSAVWVSLSGGEVLRVGADNEVAARIDLGGEPVALDPDQALVWAANGDGEISAINTQTNAVTETVEVDKPLDLTVTDDAIWSLSADGEVQRIDRISAALDPSVSFDAPGASAIDAGFGSLWLTDPRANELERFDPAGEGEWQPTSVDGATDLAVGPDSIWIGTGDDARVIQVRPST